MAARTYSIVNPLPSLVGLMERNFAVMSWDISVFGGIVPTLLDPIVDAAASVHEDAIRAYEQAHGIPYAYPSNIPVT